MLVSFASGVSTKISLCFQTSFKIPYFEPKVHNKYPLGTGKSVCYHVVPSGHYRLHIKITREEGDDTIRYDLAVLDQNAPKISHYSRVVSDFEPRADSYLIAPPCYDLAICARSWRLRESQVREHTRGRKAFRVSVIAYVS